jgi:hypothetical protein
VLRRNPRPVVGFSLVIHAILALVSIAVTALFTANALGRYFDAVQTATTTDQLDQSSVASAASSLVVASLAGIVVGIFTYGGQAILQGIIAMDVARGTVGEKLPLSALWARARGRIGVLLGWAGLVVLVAVVVFAIAIGGIVLLFALGGAGGAIAGGILVLVIILGGGALGIWLWTKMSLVPSALIIERLPLREAVRRSWTLVRGYFWRTFGIQLLVAVMVAIAASIIEVPVTLIVEFSAFAANPTGLENSAAAASSVFGVTQIASTIVQALVDTVTAIITTAVSSLIYIDLRMRKEGLDLELTRFVDARAAGSSDVPDPYLTAGSIATHGTNPAA